MSTTEIVCHGFCPIRARLLCERLRGGGGFSSYPLSFVPLRRLPFGHHISSNIIYSSHNTAAGFLSLLKSPSIVRNQSPSLRKNVGPKYAAVSFQCLYIYTSRPHAGLLLLLLFYTILTAFNKYFTSIVFCRPPAQWGRGGRRC